MTVQKHHSKTDMLLSAGVPVWPTIMGLCCPQASFDRLEMHLHLRNTPVVRVPVVICLWMLVAVSFSILHPR